ncbi:MAG: hypothetical protein LUC37_06560 [Prevotella sp.]|nr:hypothetical protein [Prevotella sp.]
MSDLRMPKGWTLVGTSDMAYGDPETKQDKLKRDHQLNSMIRNTPIRSEEEITKESDELAKRNKARKDSLAQAYEDKKLKSKDLIKEARKIVRKNKRKKNKESAPVV